MRLSTTKQFLERNPWLTEGGLRRLLFFRDQNGFGRCVVKLGRKVLIDEEAVESCLEQARNTPLRESRPVSR